MSKFLVIKDMLIDDIELTSDELNELEDIITNRQLLKLRSSEE